MYERFGRNFSKATDSLSDDASAADPIARWGNGVGFASIPLVKWNPFSWIKTLRMAPKAKVMDMAKRSIGMYATHIGYLIENPELVVENFEDGRQFMIKHGIRPVVGKEFSFDQVPEAHAFMESRQSYGKVVINVPG